MLHGHNFIGTMPSAEGGKTARAFSPVKNNWLPDEFFLATTGEIERAVDKGVKAFERMKTISLREKIAFLEAAVDEMSAISDQILARAALETGLGERRLKGEFNRTIRQIQLFREVLEEGSWVGAVIDTAMPERQPLPRPDLRKMNFPLGPVVVFGASNFPLAFSTAGGDAISALAAGNPVIIKAHPSHLGTNELVAGAMVKAVQKSNLPDGLFSSLNITDPEGAIALVKHPSVKAIAFTGSYHAGMAIYRAALNERQYPIPVYAEMSSVNPVVVLPEKLTRDGDALLAQIVASVTLDAGQFCTNPGLLFLIDGEASRNFIENITPAVSAMGASTMLNVNICKNFYDKREALKEEKEVVTLFEGAGRLALIESSVSVFLTDGKNFIGNPKLQAEIFGPATLIVTCSDKSMLVDCLNELQGQLTVSLMATDRDLKEYSDCLAALRDKAGRIVFNGVPTGVEVSHAMMHGGPFPATTDALHTSVGSDAILRFVRPVCFQDCPSGWLPQALLNENPLGIMRKINGRYTRDAV